LNIAVSNSLSDNVKIINVESSCDAMNEFLISTGLGIKGKQFEMLKLI